MRICERDYRERYRSYSRYCEMNPHSLYFLAISSTRTSCVKYIYHQMFTIEGVAQLTARIRKQHRRYINVKSLAVKYEEFVIAY